MFPTTPTQWAYVLGACGVKPATAARFADAFAAHVTPETLTRGESELDDMLGEALEESGRLEHLEENLNYSAARIRELGARFGAASRWGRAAAMADQLANNPQELAERLYGGRFGNVNEGDGWLYRGRGLPQITFEANYSRLSVALGVDLLANPDALLDPDVCVRALLAWWEDTIPDDAIDHEDRERKLVNGSTLGVEDVRKLSAAAREALRSLA